MAGANAAQFVTLATNANMANERVLTAGTNVSITDGGAGSTVTINATDTDTTYTDGNGLTLTGTTFALGTPSTLTASTANGVTASSHTHAITASSDPGAAASLLKTDAGGGLNLSDTLTLTDTSLPLRLRYDVSNYADVRVTSTGSTAIKPTNGVFQIGNTSTSAVVNMTASGATPDLIIETPSGQTGVEETTPLAGSVLSIGGNTAITDGAGGEKAQIYDTGVFNSQGVYAESFGLTGGVARTVFTLDSTDNQNIGLFTIVNLNGSDYASAILIKGSPNNQVLNIHSSSGVTISLSGDNVQATATTTGSFLYGYIKLSRS